MTGDASFEKTQRARAATQIAIWAQLDSWEGPLREYAICATASAPDLLAAQTPTQTPAQTPAKYSEKISQNPSEAMVGKSAERSISDLDRRLKFFRWEVSTLIDRKVLDLKETHQSHVDLLNEIFFEDLAFRLQIGPAALEAVIAKRVAPPALLAMLYGWVAELFIASCKAFDVDPRFSRIEIVHGVPSEVVRLIPSNDDGRVYLLDLQACGQSVSDQVWMPWCKQAPHGFARKTYADALIAALTELFVALDSERSLESLQHQLAVLDVIIALQPSETSRWADRAVLNSRIGNRPRALDDLKRFFAFHEKESAPPGLVSLFDELRTDT